MVDQIAEKPDIAEVVQAVFDDIDMRQLAISRRLSGSRHLKEAFDLCEFARSLVVASIRNRHPHISDEELIPHQAHRARTLSFGSPKAGHLR
jgi:hypothetical protein